MLHIVDYCVHFFGAYNEDGGGGGGGGGPSNRLLSENHIHTNFCAYDLFYLTYDPTCAKFPFHKSGGIQVLIEGVIWEGLYR